MYSLFLVLSLLLYFISSSVIDQNNETKLSSKQTSFFGTISSIPHVNGDRLSFQYKTANGEKLLTNYYIKSEKEQQQLKNLSVGMQCVLKGSLHTPSPPTNYFAFDYKQYLYYQKIHWNFSPESIRLDRCRPSSFSLHYMLQKSRQQGIQSVIDDYPDEAKGIVAALIFGDRGYIDEGVLEAYEQLGVIHLLAVSGLHVGLIFSALFFIFIRLGITRERTISILLLLLPVYSVIAGGAPSVLRATWMTVVVLLSLRLKKRVHSLDGISFVCLLYLFISPYSLFQLGFQLSFLISFTLIISTEIVRKQSHNFFQLLTVTFISQCVSLPIIVFHFYEISWLSLPLNLIYIPFISLVILPAVFFTYVIHILVPFIGHYLLNVLGDIIFYSHEALKWINGFSFSSILVGKFDVWLAFSLFMIILIGLYFLEKKAPLKYWMVLIGGVSSLLFIHYINPYLNAEGEVTVLDVGQGDSIFIELPYRKAVYLIDSGGLVSFGRDEAWRRRSSKFEVGKDIVVPFLKAKGIRTIDKLILTHGHFDHIGGAEALLDQVNVKELLYAKGPVEDEFERRLLSEFHLRGTTIQFVKKGMAWSKAGSKFYVLSPQGNEESLNNRSVVLLSKLGGINWLFTGDLEESGEERLIEDFPHLDVDVLKAGHHGSRTSSSPRFIDHIQPKAVLISVGRNNRFQHPHQEVITAFEERDIPIFRTDTNGAIRIKFTNERVSNIETMLEVKDKKGLPTR